MKRFFALLAASVMTMAMLSCGGEKSPVDRYEAIVVDIEKAVENKDGEAVKAAFMEMDEFTKELAEAGFEESTLSVEEQVKLKQLSERWLMALVQAVEFTE